MTQPSIGARVKRIREVHGLTQAELAKKAHVTQGFISQLESGVRKNPGVLHVQRLATALGVSVGELLGESMEWWRAEADRDRAPHPLSRAARSATGSYPTREEAESEARRLSYSVVARYQEKGGDEIRRAFPVRIVRRANSRNGRR